MEAKANKKYTYLLKVNQEMLDAIVKDIAEGSTNKHAAEANGISDSHFYYLIAQGRCDLENNKSDTIHARLVVSLRKVERDEIKKCRKLIISKQKGHKGAEWTLEHAYARYFSSNIVIAEIENDIKELQSQLKNGNSTAEDSSI